MLLDRYVMVGNHRDSWVFGGVDASSGGSVLLELAKVIGEHKKTGKEVQVFLRRNLDRHLVLEFS